MVVGAVIMAGNAADKKQFACRFSYFIPNAHFEEMEITEKPDR